jgi:hypothetical protein
MKLGTIANGKSALDRKVIMGYFNILSIHTNKGKSQKPSST